MLGYQLLVNYEYIKLLWTTPIGLVMCGVTLVLLAIGLVWIRNIVKIEV